MSKYWEIQNYNKCKMEYAPTMCAKDTSLWKAGTWTIVEFNIKLIQNLCFTIFIQE